MWSEVLKDCWLCDLHHGGSFSWVIPAFSNIQQWRAKKLINYRKWFLVILSYCLHSSFLAVFCKTTLCPHKSWLANAFPASYFLIILQLLSLHNLPAAFIIFRRTSNDVVNRYCSFNKLVIVKFHWVASSYWSTKQ